MESLYDMLAFVREEAQRAGFSPKYISKIELASEEALVNIISYAYDKNVATTEASIEIECSYLPSGGLKIQLRDQGKAYNPLENNGTFIPAQTLDDKVGGYGVFFITKLMDQVLYEREGNTNILTLIKRIGS